MSSPGSGLFRHPRGNIQPQGQNAPHQFASKHALAIYAADANYSFIPKNACSSTRYTLVLANGAVAVPQKCNLIHDKELTKARNTVVIVRDPIAASPVAISAGWPIRLRSPGSSTHRRITRSRRRC